jgi:hypothetical protein
MRQEIVLRTDKPDDRTKAMRFIEQLPPGKPWRLEVSPYRPRRTDEQNRYLWACYGTILEQGGEALGGWTREDLHEHFLGCHFGVEHLTLAGREYEKPTRRSSRLNKQEFSDYIAFIQRRAAELGIYIPDPEQT